MLDPTEPLQHLKIQIIYTFAQTRDLIIIRDIKTILVR